MGLNVVVLLQRVDVRERRPGQQMRVAAEQVDEPRTRIRHEPVRDVRQRRRAVAVSFDEFQGIGAFDGGSVEQALRAAVQQQRDVGYVFAGSEPSLMERMLGPKRPFYKAGPVMRLEKIPQDIFSTFIESRFAKTGIKPEAGLGAAIVELAGKYRLPAIYPNKEFVEAGGLMSYGEDSTDQFRRAAVYVDKILKCAKPADLPVQQATKFEFLINLKSAKQIGLTIPVRVLERANQVIR